MRAGQRGERFGDVGIDRTPAEIEALAHTTAITAFANNNDVSPVRFRDAYGAVLPIVVQRRRYPQHRADTAWRARQPDEAREFIAWLRAPVPGAPAGLDDECELCIGARERTGSSTALCWLCEVLQAKNPTAQPGQVQRDGVPERKEP